MTETYYTSAKQKPKYRANEQAVMSTTTITLIQEVLIVLLKTKFFEN